MNRWMGLVVELTVAWIVEIFLRSHRVGHLASVGAPFGLGCGESFDNCDQIDIFVEEVCLGSGIRYQALVIKFFRTLHSL